MCQVPDTFIITHFTAGNIEILTLIYFSILNIFIISILITLISFDYPRTAQTKHGNMFWKDTKAFSQISHTGAIITKIQKLGEYIYDVLN